LKLGITMLIHNKDDIEFVTEFPCFLGHPVYKSYPLSLRILNCAIFGLAKLSCFEQIHKYK